MPERKYDLGLPFRQMEKKFSQKDFEELFNHWFDDLMRFVCSYVHDEEVARDIVHDVFLSIWKNRGYLDLSWSLKSYLFTLARNYALNYLRHQKVIVLNQEELLYHSQELQEELEQYDQAMLRLNEKLGQLPRKQKEVLIKCFVEGKMYKEIADELSISLNTVKTHLKRALKFLRDELNEEIILLLLFKKLRKI